MKMNPMQNLYDRLAAEGISKQFVRDHALPHWWMDEAAFMPFNLMIAEECISRKMQIPLTVISDPNLKIRKAMDQDETWFAERII